MLCSFKSWFLCILIWAASQLFTQSGQFVFDDGGVQFFEEGLGCGQGAADWNVAVGPLAHGRFPLVRQPQVGFAAFGVLFHHLLAKETAAFLSISCSCWLVKGRMGAHSTFRPLIAWMAV